MPAVSKNQFRAMQAAASGHSTIGIPQSVGAEFVSATKPGSVSKLPKRVAKPKPRHKDALPKSAGHIFGSLAPMSPEDPPAGS